MKIQDENKNDNEGNNNDSVNKIKHKHKYFEVKLISNGRICFPETIK